MVQVNPAYLTEEKEKCYLQAFSISTLKICSYKEKNLIFLIFKPSKMELYQRDVNQK